MVSFFHFHRRKSSKRGIWGGKSDVWEGKREEGGAVETLFSSSRSPFVSCEAWKRRQAKGLFCLGSASFALPIVILSEEGQFSTPIFVLLSVEGQILVLLLVVLSVEGQFFTLIFVLLSGERQILLLPLVVLPVEGQF